MVYMIVLYENCIIPFSDFSSKMYITLFQTKLAQKPYPKGQHVPVQSNQGVPFSPGIDFIIIYRSI